jgi:glutamine synthetase adenylyltransferase
METKNGTNSNERIELLKKREAALRLLIAREQTLQLKRKEKERARLAAMVGACLLADMEDHPEVREAILQSLRRTATERDIAFLKTKGWRL